MNRRVYIANTDFEFELRRHHILSVKDSFEQHPVFLQLQFLPLAYCEDGDAIVVTHKPSLDFFKKAWRYPSVDWITFDDKRSFTSHELVAWGNSRQVHQWAIERGIHFRIPHWNSTCKVNSKAFSFTHSPKLPHAKLIWNETELISWLGQGSFSKVLKTCYGVSGRGHFILDNVKEKPWERIFLFSKKEWSHGLPIVAEPWVKRQLDFSTQWHISPEGVFTDIGATKIENDQRGGYQCTIVGEESDVFENHERSFLEVHRHEAQKILKILFKEGYFGPVGIDAMVYEDDSRQLCLHPIVEINARQTMSLAAILFQRKWFKNERVRMEYSGILSSLEGFLPENLLMEQGKILKFSKQLYFEKII